MADERTDSPSPPQSPLPHTPEDEHHDPSRPSSVVPGKDNFDQSDYESVSPSSRPNSRPKLDSEEPDGPDHRDDRRHSFYDRLNRNNGSKAPSNAEETDDEHLGSIQPSGDEGSEQEQLSDDEDRTRSATPVQENEEEEDENNTPEHETSGADHDEHHAPEAPEAGAHEDDGHASSDHDSAFHTVNDEHDGSRPASPAISERPEDTPNATEHLEQDNHPAKEEHRAPSPTPDTHDQSRDIDHSNPTPPAESAQKGGHEKNRPPPIDTKQETEESPQLSPASKLRKLQLAEKHSSPKSASQTQPQPQQQQQSNQLAPNASQDPAPKRSSTGPSGNRASGSEKQQDRSSFGNNFPFSDDKRQQMQPWGSAPDRRGQQQQQQQQQQTQLQQPQGMGMMQQTQAPQQAPAKKKEALQLRLDLNLDVDVQIKARIHGDVTLSLLS